MEEMLKTVYMDGTTKSTLYKADDNKYMIWYACKLYSNKIFL